MNQALTHLGTWLAQGRDWHVSINVAAFHFEREGFAADLKAMLARHPHVPPHLVELELLESDALVSLDAVREIIRACRALGVRTALDDFGTGYASLTYFKRLPVDTLKIDQSFVRGMAEDPENLAIVDNVVRLADAFQRDVVAEGMETVDVGETLCRFGCEVAQGYGIARPMPFADVDNWAAHYHPDPRWATAVRNDSDLSVLVVENEMRAWVDEIRGFLQDGQLEIPLREVADTRCCHLGRWYEGQGRKRYGHHPVFADIGRIHDQLHRFGADIVGQMRNGQHDEARQTFHALEESASRLRARMEALNTLGWAH
jgi:EAL domain-containing protein (putative c-di-GMP-specific phosphodiesterase class I)